MTNKENFSQSIIESEIDIKDENPYVSTEPTNFEESDGSDIEVIAVCQSTNLNKRHNLLRPIYKRKKPKTLTNSVPGNGFVSNNEKSFIKEEIIISDESDYSDDNKRAAKSFVLNSSKSNTSLQESKKRQDESLSAIILNCPKCNITEKVFSITIKSNCKLCNTNMFYICNKCNYKYDSMPALYRHKKFQCQYIVTKQRKKPKITTMAMMKCTNCNNVKKLLNLPRTALPCSCHHIMIYQCVICSRSYTSYSGIYAHIRRYCQAKHNSYYCNDCTYGCTKRKTLKRHLRQNHKEHFTCYKFFCSKCNERFEDLEKLKIHEILCGLLSCTCKFCNYKPKICTNVVRHLLANHNEEVEKEGLDNVLTFIAQGPPPKEKSKPRIALPIQQKVAKSSELDHLKSLFCPKCDRVYAFYHNAGNCMNCNKSYLFQCTPCSKKFVTSTSLHRHVRRSHTEIKYRCEKCKRGFSCLGDINEHSKTCGKDLIYECKLCQFKTRYRQSLRVHTYKLHNDKRVAFKCATCGITYKTNRAMKRHVKIGCGSIDEDSGL